MTTRLTLLWTIKISSYLMTHTRHTPWLRSFRTTFLPTVFFSSFAFFHHFYSMCLNITHGSKLQTLFLSEQGGYIFSLRNYRLMEINLSIAVRWPRNTNVCIIRLTRRYVGLSIGVGNYFCEHGTDRVNVRNCMNQWPKFKIARELTFF